MNLKSSIHFPETKHFYRSYLIRKNISQRCYTADGSNVDSAHEEARRSGQNLEFLFTCIKGHFADFSDVSGAVFHADNVRMSGEVFDHIRR